MKFEINSSDCGINAEEKYYLDEKSFDCVPQVNVDINLAITYLNIGVDSEDMRIKCLWGFSPRESWKDARLCTPTATKGSIKLLGDYESGLTWRIDKGGMWESLYDEQTGWYCIGKNVIDESDSAVSIMQNMIVVIDANSELTSVWVKPIFV